MLKQPSVGFPFFCAAFLRHQRSIVCGFGAGALSVKPPSGSDENHVKMGALGALVCKTFAAALPSIEDCVGEVRTTSQLTSSSVRSGIQKVKVRLFAQHAMAVLLGLTNGRNFSDFLLCGVCPSRSLHVGVFVNVLAHYHRYCASGECFVMSVRTKAPKPAHASFDWSCQDFIDQHQARSISAGAPWPCTIGTALSHHARVHFFRGMSMKGSITLHHTSLCFKSTRGQVSTG